MAEKRRMTPVELVDKVMGSEHADVVRESVAWVAAEIMEAEVAGQVGAALGEVAPERVAQRNGYRPRAWDTRAGEIELRIPKLRSGSYFPSFLEPRRRAEQALVAVVQEAYINGVSTRKVDRLVEQMGLHLSKDQVSRLCRGLDEQVQIFRERPLEGAYPYVWLDGKIEKVRERGGVRQKCLVIAYAVHESGRREVIGLDVGEAETESFWREFLRGLRRSGTGRSAPLRSQTPTRASRPPSPRCSGFPGSAARCTMPTSRLCRLGLWMPLRRRRSRRRGRHNQRASRKARRASGAR